MKKNQKNFECDTKLYSIIKFLRKEKDDLREKVDENMEKIKYQSDNDYNKNGDKLEDKNLKK